MKKLRLSFACMAMFAMIFTSCSKEETGANVNPETATLSFGAIVNDFMNNRTASKQAVGNIPECSEDVPAYVSVVLSRDGADVVGSDANPFEIQLVDGQIFTEEVPELQLDPDTYSLEHFAVYNDEDEVIWIAPRAGSELGGWISNPLPLSINLQAGVKKYVEVSVLCFDDREVNEYGYLFFELVSTEAVKFCFFANYCPPNSGERHYTASYSVSIWKGTTAEGDPLYTSVENITGQYENGDYYAEPLCFALPTNDDMDEDYLYYEVTLLDWTGNYGTVAPNTVESGTLSMTDIMSNFDGPNNVEYEHLRFGCGGDGTPPADADNDGTPDATDDCPNVSGPASNKGCPVEDGDADGDGVTDSVDQCDNTPAGTEVDAVGCPVEDGDADGDGVTDSVDQCDNTPAGTEVDAVGCPVEDGDADGDGVTDSVDQCDNTPAGTEVDAVGCPVEDGDADGDGVTDSVDQCDNTPAGTEVDAVGCPVDTGCVFEEGCDIADAAFPCVTLKTISGDYRYPDFQLVSSRQLSGINLGNDARDYALLQGELNEEGVLELNYIDPYNYLPLSSIVIEVRPAAPETLIMSETCREIICVTDVSADDVFKFNSIGINQEWYYIRVKAIACPPDADNDRTPDASDGCPQVPGPIANFGCPTNSECVYEENCDIEDAVSPCVNFTTIGLNNGSGSNPGFDFWGAPFSSGSYFVSNPELGGLTYVVQINEDGVLEVNFQDHPNISISAYVIEVRPLNPETGKASETCREIVCNSNYSAGDIAVFTNIKTYTPFFVRIKAIGCP